MTAVTINDVGPRDGLQNQPRILEPAARVRLVKALLDAGCAVHSIARRRQSRVAGNSSCRAAEIKAATAPESCGAAIEVPFMFWPAASFHSGTALTAAPGAMKSTPVAATTAPHAARPPAVGFRLPITASCGCHRIPGSPATNRAAGGEGMSLSKAG